MTAQQEAYQLINKLPTETVISLVELLKRIPLTSMDTSDSAAPVQFGLGKGIITDLNDDVNPNCDNPLISRSQFLNELRGRTKKFSDRSAEEINRSIREQRDHDRF